MRITRSMMVNNMLHWTEQQMGKLNDASNVVASGKQIHKPSDNPSATGQILSDRATLSQYGQYESNMDQAETWIEISSTNLEAAGSLLARAQDIMSSLATADQATGDHYLGVMENLYDQVRDLANSKYGSGYMYSGSLSDQEPFSSDGAYQGDDAGKTVIVGEGSTITLNNKGGDLFGNALSVLSQAITAIETSAATDLGAAFEEAISAIEAEMVSLANTRSQLEYKTDRLKQLMANAESRISDTEVGSREEAAIKLRAQQTSYDLTLEAVASMLKMTKLSDLM